MDSQAQNDTTLSLHGICSEYSMLMLSLLVSIVGFVLEWLTVGAFTVRGPMRRMGNSLIVSNIFADILLSTAGIAAMIMALIDSERAPFERVFSFTIVLNGLTCAPLQLGIALENVQTAREMLAGVEDERAWWRRPNLVRAVAGAAWMLGGEMAFYVYFEYGEGVRVVVVALLMGAPLTAAGVLHVFTSVLNLNAMQNPQLRNPQRLWRFARMTLTNALQVLATTFGWIPWMCALVTAARPMPAVYWLLAVNALLKPVLFYTTNCDFRMAVSALLCNFVDERPTPDHPPSAPQMVAETV